MIEKILEEYGWTGLRLAAGFNARRLAADWLGMSESTLKRREAAGDLVTARLLAIQGGQLGLIDPAWSGWTLRRGLLRWASLEFSPGDLLAMQYQRALIAELQRQVRQYEADKKAAAQARGRTLAPVLNLDDYR